MAERFLIQCGDHWENQCRVLPLALALKERGWEPVVLTYDASLGALFVAHGVAVCPLDLAGRRGGRAFQLLDGARGLSWRFGATRAAKQFLELTEIERSRNPRLLASVSGRLRRARSVARHRAVLRSLIDRLNPQGIGVWNGLTGIVANLLRQLVAERGLDAIFLERGLLPNSVFIDREGTNGAASLHRREELDELGTGSSAMPEVATSDAETLLEWHGLQRETTIFVPLQVQADTNILFHSDRIDSMRQLVEEVAAALPPGFTAVVRPHPEETNRDLQLPVHPAVRYATDGSVEGWCDAAALTVTVNSTVGLTALLRGRPVLTLGRSIYSGKGITTDAGSRDLADLLCSSATYTPPDRELVARYYALLIDHHTVLRGGKNLGVPAAPGAAARRVHPPEPDGARAKHGEVGALEAERLAAVWDERLEGMRAKARRGTNLIWARVERKHARNLTYRKTRVELDRDELTVEVATLLRIAPADLAISKLAPATAPEGLLVVLQPQETSDLPRGADLVLDQYLQPHIRWLRTLVG